jgi:drug/metabolite transporter (DMT)-like permease
MGETFMDIIKKNNASIFLFVNAILWGSSYVWSKMLLGYMPRFSILFLCSLGGLFTIEILFYSSIKKIKLQIILPCILISSFSIISNTFFMYALQYTSSSNTAFIVQMSVVITPLLMAIVDKKFPQGKTIAGAIVALSGLYLLTWDFTSFTLHIGDLLALGNALFFSLFLVGLNISFRKIDPIHFTFIHYATNTTAFLLLAGILEMSKINFNALKSTTFSGLIAASIFASVVTILFQTTSIKFVRPEKAALIYTFEPITTLILGFAILGEGLNGIKALTGCILIITAVVISLYSPRHRVRKEKKEAIHITLIGASLYKALLLKGAGKIKGVEGNGT